MKKILTLVQLGISSTFGKQQQSMASCLCQCSVIANKVTFNEEGELIFVNEVFNFETETDKFKSYTETNTNMKNLNTVKLKDDGDNREKIYLYILKVGYSPIGKYFCFKYGNIIYILREDNGKYLLPVVKRGKEGFERNIEWVCILGHDSDQYFLLKKKFEDNKNNALVLDDFISTNKFTSRNIDKEVTIIDENKEKENLGKNNGTITINNNIQINIGTINSIIQTNTEKQQINIVKK